MRSRRPQRGSQKTGSGKGKGQAPKEEAEGYQEPPLLPKHAKLVSCTQPARLFPLLTASIRPLNHVNAARPLIRPSVVTTFLVKSNVLSAVRVIRLVPSWAEATSHRLHNLWNSLLVRFASIRFLFLQARNHQFVQGVVSPESWLLPRLLTYFAFRRRRHRVPGTRNR